MNAARTRATIFLRELDIIKSCFSAMTLLCLMMVVTSKLGPKLNDYLKEFRQTMGIQ
jgi:DMSO/TMAO reductase YedYZ heme-binding membrane subunit